MHQVLVPLCLVMWAVTDLTHLIRCHVVNSIDLGVHAPADPHRVDRFGHGDSLSLVAVGGSCLVGTTASSGDTAKPVEGLLSP
jgi:hypothetical protein